MTRSLGQITIFYGGYAAVAASNNPPNESRSRELVDSLPRCTAPEVGLNQRVSRVVLIEPSIFAAIPWPFFNRVSYAPSRSNQDHYRFREVGKHENSLPFFLFFFFFLKNPSMDILSRRPYLRAFRRRSFCLEIQVDSRCTARRVKLAKFRGIF